MMTDERPHILLIMTDQQRGDCLGIEGHPVLLTPTLDQIAVQRSLLPGQTYGAVSRQAFTGRRRIQQYGQDE